MVGSEQDRPSVLLSEVMLSWLDCGRVGQAGGPS